MGSMSFALLACSFLFKCTNIGGANLYPKKVPSFNLCVDGESKAKQGNVKPKAPILSTFVLLCLLHKAPKQPWRAPNVLETVIHPTLNESMHTCPSHDGSCLCSDALFPPTM